MKLIPPDSAELAQLIAGWLSQKDNYQWLDFGDGRQLASPGWLKIAMQRGTYVMRLFTSDIDDEPIGVVALSDIHPRFKTANVWVVLGDKRYVRQGYAIRATSEMLTFGFRTLGLVSIHTWVVEGNPSIHVAERVGFRPLGRQRQCHYIDGQARDRLWFDLLASEHWEDSGSATSSDCVNASPACSPAP
jgi:RimJ/RimL family protein N-acetyltransferase